MSHSSTSSIFMQYALGEAFSAKDGVYCYPATDRDNGNRYIAKVHTFPAKPTTTEAFLLTGAFPNLEMVNAYYREQARELTKQAAILNALSYSEYFSHYTICQTEHKKDIGYDVWLLSSYRRSLTDVFNKVSLSKKDIINIGTQLCRGLTQCREAGYMYIGIKPENIFLTPNGNFQIGDVGFIPTISLSYTALPKRYHTIYSPPESHDLFSVISENADVYSVGVVLYQAVTGGKKPACIKNLPDSADNALSAVIMKACAPSPTKRWENPKALEEALKKCLA